MEVSNSGAFERLLHSTGNDTLRVVFGCEQLGGHDWGTVDIAEAEAAVADAAALGVRAFDTADVYGLGSSERRLGAAVAGRRAEVLIATKFGIRFDSQQRRIHDSSPEWCLEAAERSLDRLSTTHIDLYQLHVWDERTPLDETFDALGRLQRQGIVRAIGVCNVEPGVIPPACLARCATWSREYSLLRREHEPAARRVSDSGLTVLAYGVLAQGLLSGKYDANSVFGAGDRRAHSRYRNFHGRDLRAGLQLVPLLHDIARQVGATPAQVAIAWIGHGVPRAIPLVGIKSRAQLHDAAAAARLCLPPEALARLDATAAEVAGVASVS